MEDIQSAPRVKPNEEGKFIVYDVDGNPVYFDYAVDAKEALISKDKDGESRYFLINPKTVKSKSEQKDETKETSDKVPEEKQETRRSRRQMQDTEE